MKKTLLFLFSLSLGFGFGINKIYAASVTGEASAQVFGKMAMDLVMPGVSIEDMGAPDCDELKQTCLMKGMSWSNVIGWTAWEGSVVEDAALKKGGIFPPNYFSKVGYNGNLGGFIWGDKTGWIQLSACASQDTEKQCASKPYCQWSGSYCDLNPEGEMPGASSQSAVDWGVYIDFCSAKETQAICESAVSNPFCNWEADTNSCLFDQANNPAGQPLRGHAWSERLGWIKFGVEPGDTGFEGVFTNWPLTDLTPPEITAPKNAWIPTKSVAGTIAWTGFASEPNSKINLATSRVDYTLDPNAIYAGCNTQGDNLSATLNQVKDEINLYFPIIGLVDETVSAHHCKYSLSGVVYNSSNYGYFFGPEAEKEAAKAGVDVKNPSPHIINSASISLYTMAGEIIAKSSNPSVSGIGVADGVTALESNFSPRDIAGNPIASIPYGLEGTLESPEKSVRNVYLGYEFDASNYFFDRVEPANNELYSYPAPVTIGKEQTLYPQSSLLSYPKNGPDNNYDYNVGNYTIPIRGLAPTLAGNAFNLNKITFQTNTKGGLLELPALSPSMPVIDLVKELNLDEKNGMNLPYSFTFKPALEVTSGELSEDLVILDQPVEATFNIKNNGAINLDRFGLDHLLSFSLEGKEVEDKSLEIKDLNLLPETEPALGRTDRKSGFTRYELWQDSQGLSDLSSNEFHTSKDHFHAPLYSFEDDVNGVGTDGQYEADGKVYANPKDVAPYPPVLIDRGDNFDSDLAIGQSKAYKFSLTPSLFIGQVPDPKMEFNIKQYVAYKPESALSQFAIYPAPPLIDGVKIKTIGLGTTGVVTGTQVFEPVESRDLDNVTITSSADLRKEMRKNVAQLVRNMNLEKCDAAANSPLKALPMKASDCVLVNPVNKTIVAVYRNGTLTLGDEEPISIPKGYKYTLVLMNGANLYLKENMFYSDEQSSLGMIVLQDPQNPNKKGGNVYIDPKPTNMVGLLYAEGSLLSSAKGNDEALFYTEGGPPLSSLNNQLYWRGSIASRNTIGGGPGNIRPTGVDCSPWKDKENCSKAFDLDFLRRFTVYFNKAKDVYYTPENSLFSGGGFCNGGEITCTIGTLPTTLNLTGPNSTIIPKLSKSLNTFFIEQDNRPTPPGFTVSGGFTSSQEIR